MKDSRIRVGDKVRLINPIAVERWGYDNNLTDMTAEVLGKYEYKISEMFRQFGISSPSGRAVRAAARAIAYDLVALKMKSGMERKLYRKRIPQESVCGIYEVEKVKIVKTGKYYPARYSRDWESGYSELDESGGLDDCKTHKLLRLDWIGEWVEAVNVEKV